MRKLWLSLTALALVGISASVLAAQIVITETPIPLKKEGDVYMVPAGNSGTYYYYTTEDKTEYVCSTTAPAELVGVTSIPLNVTLGSEVRSIQCYPSTNFVIQGR